MPQRSLGVRGLSLWPQWNLACGMPIPMLDKEATSKHLNNKRKINDRITSLYRHDNYVTALNVLLVEP